MSRRWKVDEVCPIEDRASQFAHVAKHLYSLKEAWVQVVPELEASAERAIAAGCTRYSLGGCYPAMFRAAPSCRAHVCADHDRWMAPAYMTELRTAERAVRYGQHADDGSWGFVGDSGVYLIVVETGRDRRPGVRTAYRVVPRRRAADVTSYRDAAVQKLRDKSSFGCGDK